MKVVMKRNNHYRPYGDEYIPLRRSGQPRKLPTSSRPKILSPKSPIQGCSEEEEDGSPPKQRDKTANLSEIFREMEDDEFISFMDVPNEKAPIIIVPNGTADNPIDISDDEEMTEPIPEAVKPTAEQPQMTKVSAKKSPAGPEDVTPAQGSNKYIAPKPQPYVVDPPGTYVPAAIASRRHAYQPPQYTPRGQQYSAVQSGIPDAAPQYSFVATVSENAQPMVTPMNTEASLPRQYTTAAMTQTAGQLTPAYTQASVPGQPESTQAGAQLTPSYTQASVPRQPENTQARAQLTPVYTEASLPRQHVQTGGHLTPMLTEASLSLQVPAHGSQTRAEEYMATPGFAPGVVQAPQHHQAPQPHGGAPPAPAYPQSSMALGPEHLAALRSTGHQEPQQEIARYAQGPAMQQNLAPGTRQVPGSRAATIRNSSIRGYNSHLKSFSWEETVNCLSAEEKDHLIRKLPEYLEYLENRRRVGGGQ